MQVRGGTTVTLGGTRGAVRTPAPVGRLLVLAVLVIVCGCNTSLVNRADVPPPPAECAADRYLFAGRSTMRSLGLMGRSRAPLPEPDRPATIWVTADLLPFDAGPEGGPPEMTRMLCFTFDDGSGGSEWPIDEGWSPPSALSAADQGPSIGLLVLMTLGGLVVLGVSIIGFRRR